MKTPILSSCLLLLASPWLAAGELERLPYNHPGLAVDLGVGLWAWPLPMDYDGDGDLDLVVSCPDKPYNGTYFFENPGTGGKMPVFKPGVRISKGPGNARVSHVNGEPRVLTPGMEYPDFKKTGFEHGVKLPIQANIHPNKVRANEWHYADLNGDGLQDLVIGVGDWTNYGWDNAYDENGHWTNPRINGFVYFVKNTGTAEQPAYGKPELLESANTPIDVFGMPSPCLADFDKDGDLDLICGEFIDGFTYFENIGTKEKPKFARGERLKHDKGYLRMDLEMITPTPIDWDGDGDIDLICGDEDGRVAFIENTGTFLGKTPRFLEPRYFQQEAADVKCGALAAPSGIDWDGDGDDDLISGNTAGYILFYENLSGPKVAEPKWAAPKYLEAGGEVIRIMAGPNGSIQGPCESKWGYTTVCVADWDGDGLPDIVANTILGKVHWYRNIGTRTEPKLAAAAPIEVEWEGPQPALAWGWMKPEGKALLTQWRTTPAVEDLDGDGLPDLIMLDHEGYLAFFQRAKQDGKLVLKHPRRALADGKGEPLRFNSKVAGGSGRRKLKITDWDGDGKLDILINSANAELWKQTAQTDGQWRFERVGNVSERNIEGHDTHPTTVDFDGDGILDLVIGAEDGRMYYLKNPRSSQAATADPAILKSEFVYEKAPFPSCHATTIEETGGTLVASWFGGTAEGKPDVAIWTSRVENGAWTPPVEVANGVQPDGQRHPCWNPVLFQPKSGDLMLFYKVGPSPQTWWGELRTSNDGGKTWSAATRLPEGILGPIKNKPIQLPNGDFLSPTSTETPTKPSLWRVHFERSGDGGKTWIKSEPATPGVPPINAIQPSILSLGGDRLLALGRSGSKRVFQVASNDLGQTWGDMVLTSLPNPNSGTDAVTLKDGRHLLVYNHTEKGRSPLNVALSEDGLTWRAALVLESEPGEYSYPAIIQAGDGKVHITYTWKRQKVRHVVIDPAKLSPRDLVDGAWPQ